MVNLFSSGIRPIIDSHLEKLAAEKRDYGNYWSASSAGHCMRKNIFERLRIPYVREDARKQRVFSAGDVFHEWIQRITKDSGVSVAQELELQDESLMIRGHVDDLVLIKDVGTDPLDHAIKQTAKRKSYLDIDQHLILYDYKSTHSDSFHRGKNRYPLSQYHKMQVGTYMYMVRKQKGISVTPDGFKSYDKMLDNLSEARILKISKDDLCMDEHQLLWSPTLEKEIVSYWSTLNGYWSKGTLPKCTCADFEGGFMARERFNPYFYEGEPCSLAWYELNKKERIAT